MQIDLGFCLRPLQLVRELYGPIRIHVGKRAEFATNMAYGVMFIATSLPPGQRRWVRPVAIAAGGAGVVAASYAAYTYFRDGRSSIPA